MSLPLVSCSFPKRQERRAGCFRHSFPILPYRVGRIGEEAGQYTFPDFD